MTGAVSQRDVGADLARVREEDVRAILALLLERPSPTGREARLAQHVADWALSRGMRAEVDHGPGESASVVVTVAGGAPARSRSMLIYAPIDTLTEDPEFVPWFGEQPDLDRWRTPRHAGGWVAGEGAENPKGYAAAALAAALCLAQARPRSGRDVRIALCGGAMPAHSRPGEPSTLGFGSGLLRLLQRGLNADFAVACKPGWQVAHEEVGLLWLRLVLVGRGAYVGSRHRQPVLNPIPIAGRLAAGLERWFERYAASESSGEVAPQGAVSGIRSGVPELMAFVGEACELRLDVRVNPRRSLASAERLVRAAIAELIAPDVADDSRLSWRLDTIAGVPPSSTPDTSPVITRARAVWETMEGRPHPRVCATSGASDTSLLRAWGIPTARVGLPLGAAPTELGSDPFGLNVVEVGACRRLTELLVRTAMSEDEDETAVSPPWAS